MAFLSFYHNLLIGTIHSIMRPNTLHTVVTPSNTICRGGHFYSMSTIHKSIVGMYHTFFAHSWITNAMHDKASHALLSRMALFCVKKMTCSEGLDEGKHVP